jgi:hypothetical protein
MVTLSILRRKLEAAASSGSKMNSEFLTRRKAIRDAFVEDAYANGGQQFLDHVKKYGCTEKGEDITFDPWFEEFLLIIGDMRLHHVLTTGCAQLGKTLAHILFMIFCLTAGKLNAAWFYDTRTNLDANVPMQFHPVANYWISKMQEAGIRLWRSLDKTINTRFQVEQANAIFAYTSTSRPGLRNDGKAAAGSAVVSFQADLAFLEERSQYMPGAADPIPRRLDASMLPTRPIRELGTPGAGQGIESELKDVDYYFYPHFQCDGCGQLHPLDPKGCLLKPSTLRDPLGRPKVSYLSESGRPLKWFHHDKSRPVDSAYFGCPNCDNEISEKKRTQARFHCRNTGVSALSFLAGLPPGIPDRRWKIGVHLSPLSRPGKTLAEEMIKSGFDAKRTDDWQQQALGHPSSHETGSLNLEMLRLAMTYPKPQRKADHTIAGIDMGRSEDWLVVIDFFLPDNYYELELNQIIERTIRVIRFAGAVMRDDIPMFLDDYGVEFGLVDNEPSRESSMKIARKTCLQMANQSPYVKEIVKETMVEDGGIGFPCWDIRNGKFMDAVLEGFLLPAPDGDPLYRLPSEWEKWVGNPSDLSPLVHLVGPSKDSDGLWSRPGSKVDDLFFGCVFAEAGFYIKLLNPSYESNISGSYSSPARSLLNDL